jgi:hypoxanthine phosphoribosyltransferase
MKVITLNSDVFTKECKELFSRLTEWPDLVVGIKNGGTHVIEQIKRDFNTSLFILIEPKRVGQIKDNRLVGFFLKILPYPILNKLRVVEARKLGKEMRYINIQELSDVFIDFDNEDLEEDRIKNILIIDDAIDTGKTMFVAKNNFEKKFPEASIKTAVISWTINESIIKPDYYLYKDILVRFPWSKDFKGKRFEKKSFSS